MAESPPWPSGLKRWNQALVPVVRVRFEPRCGRPHFAPTRSGVRACGRNCTEAREREWAEGTVSSRVVLDSDFQADSTPTHLTIQVTQL